MQVLIMGAGAVGCFYGAFLTRRYPEIYFVTRGNQLKALKNNGLVFHYKDEEQKIPVKIVSFPEDIQLIKKNPPDFVMLCVKSRDTEDAAKTLKPILPRGCLVVAVQNGVENEAKLSEYFDEDQILGGIAFVGAFSPDPGVLYHRGGGLIKLGEYGKKARAAGTGRCEEIASFLSDAGIEVRVSKDIIREKWIKLIWNTGFNALSVLTRGTVGEILDTPSLYQMMLDAMNEVVAVARAGGVDINESHIQRQIDASDSVRSYQTSMYQDFIKGKSLENDAINGVVHRLGKERGVPTPANTFLYEAVQVLDKSRKKEL